MLKDSNAYKERYSEAEVQQVMQALDILLRLRQSLTQGAARVPWDKLYNASLHLENLLAKHLHSDDGRDDSIGAAQRHS